jgi:nitroreductase
MNEETSDLFEAMMTQRAIRSLKPDPVPEEHIARMIELATHAPNGSNRQPWAFIAVRDKEQMAKLGDGVRTSVKRIAQMVEASGSPLPLGFDRFAKLAENFEQIPVVIYPCAVLEGEAELSNYSGSLYPAIQNLLLAARGFGLGAVLTSQGLEEARAVLGLPDNVRPVAMIPVGYPDKEHYGPTKRKPVSEVLHWDRW